MPDCAAPPTSRAPVCIPKFASKAAALSHEVAPPASPAEGRVPNASLPPQPVKLICLSLSQLETASSTPVEARVMPQGIASAGPPLSAHELAAAVSDRFRTGAGPRSAVLHVAAYDSEGGALSARVSADVDASLQSFIETLLGTLLCLAPGLQAERSILLAVGSSLYYKGDYPSAVERFLTSRGKPPCVTPIGGMLLRDLSPILGAVCTLVHNGDCEHAVIFDDLYAPPPLPTPQPPVRVLWRRGARVRPCDVCGVAAATVAVAGHPLADKSPFLFCAGCRAMAGALPVNAGHGCGEFPLEDPLGKTTSSR